jgi:hypothetical protein
MYNMENIAVVDIERRRNDTAAEEFKVLSSVTGSAIDITSYSFTLTVNQKQFPVNDDDQVMQISGAITDAAAGLVEFVPSAGQADRVGSFFYDVEMIDPAGRIRTIATGRWRMVEDITKN